MNPYQPPAEEDAPRSRPRWSGSRRATITQRFAASLIDLALATSATSLVFRAIRGSWRFWQRPAGLKSSITWTAVSVALWLATHGYFLIRDSQTIGQRILGIRIANQSDGQKTAFWQIIFGRYLPLRLIALIPKIGGVLILVDYAFILRKDERCIHDHLAGTVVVKVDAP